MSVKISPVSMQNLLVRALSDHGFDDFHRVNSLVMYSTDDGVPQIDFNASFNLLVDFPLRLTGSFSTEGDITSIALSVSRGWKKCPLCDHAARAFQAQLPDQNKNESDPAPVASEPTEAELEALECESDSNTNDLDWNPSGDLAKLLAGYPCGKH